MEESNNTVYFESDDEFTDFCVAPYAVVKQSEKGTYYVEGEYSDEYLECLKKRKTFVIKDENSVVFKRQCVTKRVPVEGTNRTTSVQLDIENLERFWEE
jgi:hypothetical protein